jgi:hypothetical protein
VKIYIASSWRNPLQPAIVHALRRCGHEVYDFRNPKEGDTGFGWQQVMPSYVLGGKVDPVEYRECLRHPIAEAGYANDIGALRWCDAIVYVMPCGRSASWEFGYAMGQGKAGYVCMFGNDEPDLMFSEAKILVSMNELFDVFGEPLQDAAPDLVTRCCDSCVLGGDDSEKPCELREDTGIPGGSAWLCADCYAQWREQP